MKKVLGLLVVAGLASVAQASVSFSDSQNELFDNSFGHLDITSVDVSHDANFITFVINVRGSMDSNNGGTNWGKYCIGIDVPSNSSNQNGTGSSWNRNVSWGATQGIDFWVGTWADNNGFGMGGELRALGAGGSDPLLDATYTTNTLINGSISAFSQTIRLSRAALGLTGDGKFFFDVLSTGGGADPGVDHLSRADQATPFWDTQSVAGDFLSYTIPTPGAAALLGLGGLVAARRRRA
jgi:hypothetical protein